MFVIANNISTRESKVEHIFRKARDDNWDINGEPARMLMELAQQCTNWGADALEINIQQHFDQPAAMSFAVNAVQKATKLRLCLSTDNADALETGLNECRVPPIVNSVYFEEDRLKYMMPMAARCKASVILLVSDPASTTDAREMAEKTGILVGVANQAGIPNEDLFVDPGIVHVTKVIGQRHMVEILEFLRALPEAAEPAVRSTCWLENSSAGAPTRLRTAIEATLLPMLAGAGLSSVFLDILRWENRRALRLISIFNNEVIYSDSEAKRQSVAAGAVQ